MAVRVIGNQPEVAWGEQLLQLSTHHKVRWIVGGLRTLAGPQDDR